MRFRSLSRRAGRATWGAWATVWWEQRARKVEPGTLARDLNRRTKHLDPRWAGERLDRISRDDIQQWVDELSLDAGLAPRSVARTYHLLSASMKAAVVDGRLAHTPCVGIELPTAEPPDERYLTPAEVAALAHFLPTDRDRLMLWTLVGTGVRWGELAGTHAHRVAVEHRRLDVHETFDDRMGELKPYPKSRRKRSVPLPPWLADMLRDHLADLDPVDRCSGPHRGRARCRSGLLFPGPFGGPVRYKPWKRGFDDAVRRSGIGPTTPHDTRHTYASWVIQDGGSLEELADLLGHSSILVTMRYAHLAQARWDGVRDILTARVAPVLPPSDLGLVAETRGP